MLNIYFLLARCDFFLFWYCGSLLLAHGSHWLNHWTFLCLVFASSISNRQLGIHLCTDNNVRIYVCAHVHVRMFLRYALLCVWSLRCAWLGLRVCERLTVAGVINCVYTYSSRYEYHWCDGAQYKKPTKLPAPQYISLLMDWIDSKINDEEMFPSTTGKTLASWLNLTHITKVCFCFLLHARY